ncbi:hypothetical protein LC085_11920 [Bacillus tianshenii]|uniref:hypothetical protein n=1 Tax=Sutcliffiella tianshenii TaxID=1463404 RepID=UPI001CD4699D|nr:hypothetical protein [Bacillus tianshenii]MCA1320619.1 hypothetical protein [Bacillus tianshenii]
MLKDINEGLILLKAEIRKKEKWDNQLKHYRIELADLEKDVLNLENTLEMEQKDVERLEGFSVTKFFLTLRGTADERLEEEKKEVAAVQLRLEEARLAKKEVMDLINDLEDKLNHAGNVEKDYEKLFATKEQYLKESNSRTSTFLYESYEKEADVKALQKELNEAIHAGTKVNDALKRAIDSLEKAKGWGTVDMIGGGLLSTALKHGHMDDSSGHVHEAQYLMRKFQKELLDLNQTATMELEVSGLLKFSDYFFDGIIMDMLVQDKITISLENTKRQQNDISRLLSNLRVQLGQKNRELDRILSERKEFVESV